MRAALGQRGVCSRLRAGRGSGGLEARMREGFPGWRRGDRSKVGSRRCVRPERLVGVRRRLGSRSGDESAVVRPSQKVREA